MNMRAVFTVAVLLSFAAGFMSAESIMYHSGNTGNIIVSNNTKIMALNDRDYYPVALSKINEAKKSIHMVMYEIRWYGNPDGDYHEVSKLGVALVKAEKRGVDVKVIMDDGRGHGFSNPDLVYAAQNWSKYFKAHGVKFEFDWSNITTHDKLIIIDDYIVIVGSTNWSQSALKYNHEANALIESKEVAREYEKYYNYLWNTFAS